MLSTAGGADSWNRSWSVSWYSRFDSRRITAALESAPTCAQVRFVDEPQASVKDADALVQELMQRLADNFADERGRLEHQWEQGQEASTEDLRTALQQYRSFFRRLLVA